MMAGLSLEQEETSESRLDGSIFQLRGPKNIESGATIPAGGDRSLSGKKSANHNAARMLLRRR
jgi:hypothetical protein